MADWIAIGAIIAGGGGVWYLIELYRQRPRFDFYTDPSIDVNHRVKVEVIQKARRAIGFITYVDVVSVRSRVYGLLHFLTQGNRIKGGISVLTEPLLEGGKVELKGDEPHRFRLRRVEDEVVLPLPWRPWKAMQMRPPRVQDLRVKAKWGTKPASYKRLKMEKGVFDD